MHNIRITAELIPESEGGYTVYCPELDIYTQGETQEECLQNLKEAAELHLEELGCASRRSPSHSPRNRGPSRCLNCLKRQAELVPPCKKSDLLLPGNAEVTLTSPRRIRWHYNHVSRPVHAGKDTKTWNIKRDSP